MSEPPKVIPFVDRRDQRNRCLDEEILDQDRNHELERMADDALDELEFQRIIRGDATWKRP